MNYTELCEQVTASIIDSLESGQASEWSAPWHRIGSSWAPRNAKTAKYYGGSNVIALACEAMEPTHPTLDEYPSPWWATYRQWSDLGGQVRKGERITSIVKWVPKAKNKTKNEPAPPTTPDGTPMNHLYGPQLIPKVYGVFNLAQVDGWEPPAPAGLANHTPIEAAETWIASSRANITYGSNQAFYSPSHDRIEVPAIGQYNDPLDHYATVCHELTHWTSAAHRLNRQLGERFGDDACAAEELVAELGAAFTTARLGITNTPRADHVNYLGQWLRILKADPKALFAAASQAQKAVDYIAALQTQPDQAINRAEVAA